MVSISHLQLKSHLDLSSPFLSSIRRRNVFSVSSPKRHSPKNLGRDRFPKKTSPKIFPTRSEKTKKLEMLPKLIFVVIAQLLFRETAWARSLLRDAPQLCPIDQGNLLDVQLFVQSANQCFDSCEKKEDCNFYRQAWLELFVSWPQLMPI